MPAAQPSQITTLEIEEGIPFIVRGFTADGLTIVQLINHPVGYRKTGRLILVDSVLKNTPNEKGKKYLRVENSIKKIVLKINGPDMEIILPDRRRKLNA